VSKRLRCRRARRPSATRSGIGRFSATFAQAGAEFPVSAAAGLVPYTGSYLWIDVEGFDSPDGTKGRWMVQGWYGPEPVPSAIRNYMGLPVQLGVTTYQRDGDRVHAALSSDGVNVIDATITLKEGPIHRSGFLNYLALGRNLTQPAPSAFVVNRIAGSNESTPATPVSMEFHFRETDAAIRLQRISRNDDG
jgi:hypothetical protein